MALALLLGYLSPAEAVAMKPLGDAFIRLISMVITLIIFCTVVSGIAGMQDIIRRVKGRGPRIVGVTIIPRHNRPPVDNNTGWSPAKTQVRHEVNAWIRTKAPFDAVIDFDATVRDPAAPVQLLAIYDSGDHIHPSDAGYQALANAISLGLFGL